jgi:putative ABC transport system permease protein
MKFLLTTLSILTTALRRLAANAGLALCALVALTAAVALAVSIPVYAEGASLRVLQNELQRQEERAGRSPFALLFRYVASQNQNRTLPWSQVTQLDSFVAGAGVGELRLPLDGLARHARTDQARLLLPPNSGAANPFLKNVTLGFMSGMDNHIRMVDGNTPIPASDLQNPVEVMISRTLADEVGINVGDRFSVVATVRGRAVPIPVEIAGLWEALNPRDPAWFYQIDSFRDVLLMPESTFTGPVAEALQNPVSQVLWFVRLSGDRLTATEAAPLLGRVERVRAQAAGLLPGLRLEQSPAEALTQYRREADALTLQLVVFGAPILGLILYFAALVAALLVQRQRSEIALLKTRGVRDSQILGIYMVEWVLLGSAAMAVGPSLGLGFAGLMASTSSFLQLSPDLPPLPLTLTPASLQFGLAAVLLTMGAALLPAFFATRRTLVDEQQQAARSVRKPFWQRFYLDMLLLLPAGYGVFQLRQGGGMFGSGSDPFANPLLLLIPLLFCFSLGLVAVRLIPLLLELLARLATIPRWTAPLVALRALARQPGNYRGPLLLLILTLSLAAFSASMAATLDEALATSITYRVGAATQLIETGESTEQPQGGGGQGGGPQAPERRDIREEPRFLFVPVDDHLEVPGIKAAARVGSYNATIRLGGANQNAQLVGIDREDFGPIITSFDATWAGGESLGGLMNMLALNPDGVIVSRSALERGLKLGDSLPATLELFGDRREVSFRIIAAVDLWPGFYPQDGPILVANLNYIFDQMGGQYPYDVWISRDPAVPLNDVVNGVRGLGITVIDAIDRQTLIREEQARPRRQGTLGLLSVGFVAAGALTLLGFLIATLITARRRAIELGVLRALGMGGGGVGVALAVEQLTLVAAGIGAGTGIGLLASLLVVPLLQVGVGPQPGTPPSPPQIAWDQVTLIYIVFAAALLLTLFALAWLLGRMRLFQAVKLGDAN